MKHYTTAALLALFATTLVACDDKAEAQEARAPEVAAAPAALPAEKTPEEKAAEAKAAEEAAAREKASAEAEADLKENPLTECCRALGKKGFTERSVEYATAARACGMAMQDNKDLAGATAMIEKELGGKPLLDECKAK